MKDKNKVFFSDKEGITSTSAQHLCNIGREYVRSTNAQISTIHFYNEKVSDLLGNAEAVNLKKGLTTTDNIEADLLKISKINSFIAWMQEAIRAKNEELDAVKHMILSSWAEERGLTINPPKEPSYVVLEDKVALLSIKDRATYYYLQAKAAAIGKAIHPGGPVHEARIEAMEIASKPNTLVDNKVFSKEVSLPMDDIDTLYFKLQKMHRETEASFNALKGSLEQEVTIENASKSATYTRECMEYEAKKKTLDAQFKEWKIQETKTISKLKIVIPNDLQYIYEFLSNL